MDQGLDSRSFPAETTHLFRIRQYIRDRAELAALSSDVTDDLLVAVSEAAANSALHTDCEELTVRWDSGTDRIEVHVEDDGVFAPSIPVPELNGDGRGGRGIPLMMALMDEVTISQGSDLTPGTVVRLVKYPG